MTRRSIMAPPDRCGLGCRAHDATETPPERPRLALAIGIIVVAGIAAAVVWSVGR